MKSWILGVSWVVICNYPLLSQDIPGLSYCLLFDSHMEKTAFENRNNDEDNQLIFFLAHEPDVDSSLYERVKSEIQNFSEKLNAKRRRFKTEPEFLHYVFNKV